MTRYVSKEDALANPLRPRLLELVGGQPGINMRQLAQQLTCQPSTIIWHAAKLQRAGLLRSERVGALRVFYLPNGGTVVRNQSLETALLKHEVARRIHDAVTHEPGIAFTTLAQRLLLNTSVLRWHARRLVRQGVLCLGRGPGRRAIFYPGSQPGSPCHVAREAVPAC